MTLLLIGSEAIKYRLPQWRKPLDVDLVATYDNAQEYIKQQKPVACYPINEGRSIYMKSSEGKITEIEVAWEGSRAERLLEFVKGQEDNSYGLVGGARVIIPSLDVSLLLKESHKYKKDSVHFLKTLRDIQALNKVGAKIREEHVQFLKEREQLTYENTLPKLNQSKANFFDNSNGIYTLQHDDIHIAIKHLDKPAYEYFKPDTAEVMTSKEMFFACSREVQLLAAYEEICVLSLERSIYPFKHTNYKWAFDMAHMKLATSISSGYFRKFVYNEYDEIQAMYNPEYVERFYKALVAGEIAPFEESLKEAA